MESIDVYSFLDQFDSAVNIPFNAIEIDAEKNPKTKEFLFLRSIEIIKSFYIVISDHSFCDRLIELNDEIDEISSNRNKIYENVISMLKQSNVVYDNEKKTLIYAGQYSVSDINYNLDRKLFGINEDKYMHVIMRSGKLEVRVENCKWTKNENMYINQSCWRHIDFDDSKLKEAITPFLRVEEIVNEAKTLYAKEIKEFELADEFWNISLAIPYYNKHVSEFKNILDSTIIGVYDIIFMPFGNITVYFDNENNIVYQFFYRGIDIDQENSFSISHKLKDLPNFEEQFIYLAISNIPLLNCEYEGIEHARKQIEIERLYYHLSELVAEEARLTKEVEEKERRCNSLKELIGIRKYNLQRLENEILAKTCERDELDEDCRRLRLYQELNSCELDDRLLIEEKKALESIPYIHKQYIATRDCFNKYSTVLMKLNHEKEKMMKEYKCKEKIQMQKLQTLMHDFMKEKQRSNDELAQKQKQFDEDCEAYEMESTKWKSQQESKFAKYQHKIDTYDDVVCERDKYLKEMNELKEKLDTVTSERDKYKITVETMMQYRQ